MTDTFGFPTDIATLICSLYDKIDLKYASETSIQRAWRCSRLLGGICYDSEDMDFIDRFKWKDVAGIPFWILTSEEDYFTEELGYTEGQYYELRNAIRSQHTYTSTPDFAHMQISLASRLAVEVSEDFSISNIGTLSSDENVSYLAGWLGDATLTGTTGTTSFKNDDYCADLDAENTYRLILRGISSIHAFDSYYLTLSSRRTRADIFVEYLSYETVVDLVFEELEMDKDNQDHWNSLETKYPDTYNFLLSLKNGLADMGEFAD